MVRPGMALLRENVVEAVERSGRGGVYLRVNSLAITSGCDRWVGKMQATGVIMALVVEVAQMNWLLELLGTSLE